MQIIEKLESRNEKLRQHLHYLDSLAVVPGNGGSWGYDSASPHPHPHQHLHPHAHAHAHHLASAVGFANGQTHFSNGQALFQNGQSMSLDPKERRPNTHSHTHPHSHSHAHAPTLEMAQDDRYLHDTVKDDRYHHEKVERKKAETTGKSFHARCVGF